MQSDLNAAKFNSLHNVGLLASLFWPTTFTHALQPNSGNYGANPVIMMQSGNYGANPAILVQMNRASSRVRMLRVTLFIGDQRHFTAG